MADNQWQPYTITNTGLIYATGCAFLRRRLLAQGIRSRRNAGYIYLYVTTDICPKNTRLFVDVDMALLATNLNPRLEINPQGIVKAHTQFISHKYIAAMWNRAGHDLLLLDRTTLCAGCLVLQETAEGKIRLCLVCDKKGFWGFPKGKLDRNETLVACAERETWEETGLDRRTLTAIDADFYVEEASICEHIAIRLYVVFCNQDVVTLSPRDKDEITEARFFDVDHLSQILTRRRYLTIRPVLELVAAIKQ